MSAQRYTREELEQDLAHLIKDWDEHHKPTSPASPLTTDRQQPRKPRRVWLGSMADITDDYPFGTKTLREVQE